MVRREVELGAAIVARWDESVTGAGGGSGESHLDVTPLPFAPLSAT
jgi:hypothetical protein